MAPTSGGYAGTCLWRVAGRVLVPFCQLPGYWRVIRDIPIPVMSTNSFSCPPRVSVPGTGVTVTSPWNPGDGINHPLHNAPRAVFVHSFQGIRLKAAISHPHLTISHDTPTIFEVRTYATAVRSQRSPPRRRAKATPPKALST